MKVMMWVYMKLIFLYGEPFAGAFGDSSCNGKVPRNTARAISLERLVCIDGARTFLRQGRQSKPMLDASAQQYARPKCAATTKVSHHPSELHSRIIIPQRLFVSRTWRISIIKGHNLHAVAGNKQREIQKRVLQDRSCNNFQASVSNRRPGSRPTSTWDDRGEQK